MKTTTNIQYLSLTPISTFDGLSKWHEARINSIQIGYNFYHQVSNWWCLLDFFTFRNIYLVTQTIIILTILMNYVWLMDKEIIFAVVAILGQIRRKFHPWIQVTDIVLGAIRRMAKAKTKNLARNWSSINRNAEGDRKRRYEVSNIIVFPFFSFIISFFIIKHIPI